MYKLYILFSVLLCSITSFAQKGPYSRFFYDVPGGPAEILDFKDNRVLFWRDSAYHIHQLYSADIIDIPLHSAPAYAERQVKRGWLTDSGAFITTIADVAGMVSLYEWRNNSLLQIEKQATKVEVGGNYALFTSWGYFYHKRPGEETARISTNPGTFAMSPEGWYVYSLDDTLYRYKDGAITPFAIGEETTERFLYVEIDKQQVLYMMEKAHQNPTLYFHNGTSADTVAILRGVHQQVYPKRQYHLHNGYVAYVSIDRQYQWPSTIAESNVYVWDSTGKTRLAYWQGGNRSVNYVYPEIRGIDDAGGLLVRRDDYMWQNGLHYTALDSASKFVDAITWNSYYVPGIVYKDSNWYTFYRDSVFRLKPDTAFPHSVQSFEVPVPANTPYHLTLEKLLEHYTGAPYQLKSVGIFSGPKQGYLIVGQDTLNNSGWIDRGLLDSVWYVPFQDVTGLDSMTWTVNDQLSSTGTAKIMFRIYSGLPPVVSLSANINVINNNTDTIIITAHGNGPGLYTFARDARFKNILKGESEDTVLKLPPSAFAKGNNDVYVRMKVGDSTVTDNIRIVKTIFSGIPGKNLIIVYPNPFTSQFTVEGLQTTHQYKLTLHALNGTILYTTLANYLHKVTVVPNVTLRKGIYFLEVFDLTVQKVTGGMVLIKL